jgi:hypothetical protein
MTENLKQCSICFLDSNDKTEDDKPLIFIECYGEASKHSFCHECIERFLIEQVIREKDKKALAYYKENKKISCPLLGHCGNCISEDEIFNVSNKVTKTFYKACNILDLEILEKQYSDREKKIVESAVNDAIQEQNSQQIVKNVISKMIEILTDVIACPYCKKTFVDFSGCMALTCSACGKGFCGVCMKVHPEQSSLNDAHDSVLVCVNSLPENIRQKYGLNGYFMNGSYWEPWKERIKVNGINNYLKTLHKEVVLKNYNSILMEIKKTDLLTQEGIDMLSEMVFSHDMDAVHLLRIPNVYWLIYSTKHNVKFEDAVNYAVLDPDDRKNVGLSIVAEIRKLYPNWKDVKKKVPGETFNAVNYPPEFMGIIAKVIETWGIEKGRWGKYPESAVHQLPRWSGPPQTNWAEFQQFNPQQNQYKNNNYHNNQHNPIVHAVVQQQAPYPYHMQQPFRGRGRGRGN